MADLPLVHKILKEDVTSATPGEALKQLLLATLELVSILENDFTWSKWKDNHGAREEILKLIQQLDKGLLPDQIAVSVLFAPTGPLQELSLSSGWAEVFLKVAEKFDDIERRLWIGNN